ncbi:MAG: hypothetical protein GY930_22855 [bacterium]|nr:hypothetical protein [bacterium]
MNIQPTSPAESTGQEDDGVILVQVYPSGIVLNAVLNGGVVVMFLLKLGEAEGMWFYVIFLIVLLA